jgi:hypothetical protein
MASGLVAPRKKAEHMAAPTNAANMKKVLANSEPFTHGTSETNGDDARMSLTGGNPDIAWISSKDRVLIPHRNKSPAVP